MMALAMALVGDAVPKSRIGRAMGLLGTMSAVGTALGPSLGGVLIAHFGWQAIFLVNVPLGVLALVLARRNLPADRRASKAGHAGFDTPGNAAAGADACGVRARDDVRARQVRPGQHGAARSRGTRCRAVRDGRSASRVAVDPIGEVSRSGAECEPGHDRARVDRDDGNAGGRAVLPRSCAWPRHGACRNPHVRGARRRRADRCARRTQRGPLRRAAHHRQRARRDGDRVLGAVPGADLARHRRLCDSHRRRHRQLCAVPDGQQLRRHDGCPSGPARSHFRNAQPVEESRPHHGRLRRWAQSSPSHRVRATSRLQARRRSPAACGSRSQSLRRWSSSRWSSHLRASALSRP